MSQGVRYITLQETLSFRQGEKQKHKGNNKPNYNFNYSSNVASYYQCATRGQRADSWLIHNRWASLQETDAWTSNPEGHTGALNKSRCASARPGIAFLPHLSITSAMRAHQSSPPDIHTEQWSSTHAGLETCFLRQEHLTSPLGSREKRVYKEVRRNGVIRLGNMI